MEDTVREPSFSGDSSAAPSMGRRSFEGKMRIFLWKTLSPEIIIVSVHVIAQDIFIFAKQYDEFA